MRELQVRARLREASSGDGRTVTGIAVPWMTPTDATETGMAEQFARGAIDPASVVGLPLRWRHLEPIGAITAARDVDEGLEVTARIADTSLGRDTVALLRELPDLGMSIRFIEAPDTDWTATPVTYHGASCREISLTDQPAYRTARVHHVREREEPTMDTATQAPDVVEDLTEDRTRETPTVRETTGTDLGRELERLREQVTALSAAAGSSDRTGEASPLTRFRSLGEYALHAWSSTESDAETRSRALATQLVANNPGVTQPTWLKDIKGLVDKGRPFLSNLGGTSALPPKTVVPSWPYYDGTLSSLIGEQASELTEVTTARVDIKRATGTLKTYAGGSRMSRQTLEMSDPAYYDQYLTILMQAWARVTEATALAAAEAASTTDIDDVYDADDPATLFQAVISAAAALEDATGSGPDVVVVKPSLWVGIASALDAAKRPLYAATNPANAPGTSTSPGALSLTVAGIPLVRGAVATTAAAVVTNRAAFGWLEDGPRVITQDQVAILALDAVLYGYAAAAPYVPAGIITITPTT